MENPHLPLPLCRQEAQVRTCGIEFDMEISRSDERDSCWEQYRNTFRVYFFEGQQHAVDTFDISDAIFSEVIDWAEQEAGDRLYAVTLVALNERGERGLIWLNGYDANSQPGILSNGDLWQKCTLARSIRNPREDHDL